MYCLTCRSHHSIGASKKSVKMTEFGDAKNFVRKVKKANPTIYRDFLRLLSSYRSPFEKNVKFIQGISHLFRNDPDLLREFTHFFPDSVQEKLEGRTKKDLDSYILSISVKDDDATVAMW